MSFSFNPRAIVMIAVALLVAGLTALFARGWLNSQRASFGQGASGHQVLVAKSDIVPGRFLRAQDLRWQGWPQGALAPSYVLQGKRKAEEFDGAVARHTLVAGQPLTDAMVVRPGEQGFLAAVLEPDMRAVSIRVDAITGISGFVIPGDRVDVILTHTVASEDRRTTRHVSETVLQDIRVIAVDQKIEDRNTKAAVAKTVTFEVTPKQVEAIGIIDKIGKISLSLRPVAREARPETGSREARPESGSREARPETGSRPAPPATVRAVSEARAAEMPVDAASGDLFEEESLPAPRRATEEKPSRVPAKNGAAGITLDSEVSRVIGHDMKGGGRTVSVVRGAKSEDQKF